MQSNWYSRDLNIRRAVWTSWALLTNTAAHAPDRVSLPHSSSYVKFLILASRTLIVREKARFHVLRTSITLP